MEQTSSAAYPNVLALRYLRDSEQVAPQIEMKARNFVNVGYQKLLTFQNDDGGFTWWGNGSEEGNLLLTAFAIQQFEDMAKVHEVDPAVINRSRSWLKNKQNSDGSWEPTSHLHGYNQAIGSGKLRTTAYVLWSLLAAGDRGGHLDRAAKYVIEHRQEAGEDNYSQALCAVALAHWDAKAPACRAILDELVKSAEEVDKSLRWTTKEATSMYARGEAAAVETTALVAQALSKAGTHTAELNKALGYLVKAKGAQGDWGSTQATILALKALLDGLGGVGGDADMTAEVLVDGKRIKEEHFNPENSDVLRLVDAGVVTSGDHRVEIKASGPGNVMYQIVGLHYRPWPKFRQAPENLALDVRYDRSQLKVNDLLKVDVDVKYHRAEPTFMVIVDLGVPPSFEVQRDDLEALITSGLVQRYSATGRQITLYVGEMSKEKGLSFSYRLKAKHPVKAKIPQSVAYEYYSPDSRAVQTPQLLVVR